jgi:glycosyltransferase involved in cell wall biosynthesis
MQKLSYCLTTEIRRRMPARIISWGGSQRWMPLWLVWAFVRALSMLLRNRVSLIHVGDPVLGPLGVLLRSLGRVPVVVNAHGLDVIYPHALYQAIVPPSLGLLDRVICISAYTKEQCVRRGVLPERCVVIPPGIDVDAYTTCLPAKVQAKWLDSWGVDAEGRHILLAVGRMVPRKGFVPLVSQVLTKLSDRRQDWVCLLVGDGPERHLVETAVQDHGLGQQVRLLGELSDGALQAAYALSDLFVMPNVPVPGDMEGFGVVTLEARAAGLPSVATDLEGISEALGDRRDGTLVPAGGWTLFAEAISDWLDARELPAQREARRERVRTAFAWDQIAARYIAVFEELQETHRARRGPLADRG